MLTSQRGCIAFCMMGSSRYLDYESYLSHAFLFYQLLHVNGALPANQNFIVMDTPSIKKGWIIVISIILLFVLLNPTSRDFKEYKGITANRSFTKPSNLLIFSVYYYSGHNYLGIFKNFIPLN